MREKMKELEYPFDGDYILKKKKGIKKAVLANGKKRVPVKIAILGGSTTNDIKLILELFLLDYGLEPEFYESEYDQFYEDVMFDNEKLVKFCPDIIYIHTSGRNIKKYPLLTDPAEHVEKMLEEEYQYYVGLWEKIEKKYH